ncbi:MAG: hypothetical protein ACRDST_03470 [Pseudonocardiaceae bacterium]
MLIVDQIVGNRHENSMLDRDCERAAADGALEVVSLPFHDAQRGRMRLTTDAGTEVGVALDRGIGLRDGDVLYCNPNGRQVITVAVAPSEALSIRLVSGIDSDKLFELGVRVGHVLGNQHWPIRLSEGRVLVPVSVNRTVMETVLRTYRLDGIDWEFVAVPPDELPAAMPRSTHTHA